MAAPRNPMSSVARLASAALAVLAIVALTAATAAAQSPSTTPIGDPPAGNDTTGDDVGVEGVTVERGGGVGISGGAPRGALSRTGFDPVPIIIAALTLLALGGGLLLAGRPAGKRSEQ